MSQVEVGMGLYEIPQEMVDFRETIRQIATEKIAPRAGDIDRNAEYPHDIRKILGEQDILGLPFDEEYGGTGTGTLMLQIGGRGDRQGVRLERPDPDDPGARHAADPALRLRRAERALPAQVRDRRVVAGLRPLGARGRLRPARRCAPPRSKTATSG